MILPKKYGYGEDYSPYATKSKLTEPVIAAPVTVMSDAAFLGVGRILAYAGTAASLGVIFAANCLPLAAELPVVEFDGVVFTADCCCH